MHHTRVPPDTRFEPTAQDPLASFGSSARSLLSPAAHPPRALS
jgi:hypothetical protein